MTTYHNNQPTEPQNGEYLHSPRIWEQLDQRVVTTSPSTDKQTPSQAMAASDWKEECLKDIYIFDQLHAYPVPTDTVKRHFSVRVLFRPG